MKASESNSRYTGKVRECTNYSVRGIKNLFKDEDIHSRHACSQGEQNVQKHLQAELQNFCDEVYAESFTARINTNKITNIFTFVFMLLSALAIILSNFVVEVVLFASVGFSFLALASMLGLFNKFAKSKKSLNIIAKRKSLGVATHKVVFCANTDAPFKRRITKTTENSFVSLTFIGIFLHLGYDVFLLGSTYYKLFDLNYTPVLNVISYFLIGFTIFPLICIFAINTHSGTAGVADNLSGSFACVGAMRYLSEFDLRLDNTDVFVVLTGAKNANFAGAKAYVDAHANEDKNCDTLFVCVDTIKGVEQLSIKSGTNKGTKLVFEATENAKLSPVKSEAKYLKGDASVFSKAGINCATITTLGATAPDFYGTKNDNLDNLDTKSTEATINILLESAYLVDSKSK